MAQVISHHSHHAHAPYLEGGTPPGGPYAVPAVYGVLATLALLGLYFGALTLLSGWEFTMGEFSRYWPFVLALAGGFGVQVAMFTRLRVLAGKSRDSGAIVAASGTTSTAAMVSCCAHYLVNVAPVLGATGFVTFAAQFQVELYWAGLAFSLAGVAFVSSRVLKAEKEHAKCAA